MGAAPGIAQRVPRACLSSLWSSTMSSLATCPPSRSPGCVGGPVALGRATPTHLLYQAQHVAPPTPACPRLGSARCLGWVPIVSWREARVRKEAGGWFWEGKSQGLLHSARCRSPHPQSAHPCPWPAPPPGASPWSCSVSSMFPSRSCSSSCPSAFPCHPEGIWPCCWPLLWFLGLLHTCLCTHAGDRVKRVMSQPHGGCATC